MLTGYRCPSCGGTIEAKNKASLYFVCPYCQTVSYKEQESLEEYGKVAELIDNGTPIQIGTTGEYQGKRFEVIGRLQLQTKIGYWNEWFIQYSDQSTGWLAEAYGYIFLLDEVPFKEDISIEDLKPGEWISIADRLMMVKEVRLAKCISAEGELPFAFEDEYEYFYADLVDHKGHFATIDYSEDRITFFLGKQVDFEEFAFQNLRNVDFELYIGKRIESKTIRCGGCGASLSVRRFGQSKAVVCEYCYSEIDLTTPQYRTLGKIKQLLEESEAKTLFPLGARVRFPALEIDSPHAQEEEYELLGYMVRGGGKNVWEKGKIDFQWTEYLFASVGDFKKYLWLVESDGHFNLIKQLPHSFSDAQETFEYTIGDRTYPFQLYYQYQSRVLYVVGEFFWKVRVGDDSYIKDFIAPPYLLSKDYSFNYEIGGYGEVNDSFGQYLTQEELVRASGIEKDKLPPIKGINPIEPNPYQWLYEKAKRWVKIYFIATAVLSFFVSIGLCLGERPLLEQWIRYNRGWSQKIKHRTRPFFLDSPFLGNSLTITIKSQKKIRSIYMHDYTLVLYRGSQRSAKACQKGQMGKKSIVVRYRKHFFGDYDQYRYAPLKDGCYQVEIVFRQHAKLPTINRWVLTITPNRWGWFGHNLGYILAFIGLYYFLIVRPYKSFESRRWSG